MHRKNTDSWHLPKGTQESGETLEQTAIREVYEETGLHIQLDCYVGKLSSTFERNGNEVEKETHYFLAHVGGGDITNHDHEHDLIEYVDLSTAISRLQDFSLYEEEGKILKAAEKMLQN